MTTPRCDDGSLRYCLLALATASVLVAAVAAFNFVVDPFDMYRGLVIDGFNRYKPAVFHRVRLFKAFELRRMQPQAIVLGSSRTHIGIGCAHPGWRELAASCHNVAFDGATTREMYGYLLHAHAIRPLRRVVLGLDTYHPVPAPSFVRPDFDPLLLHRPDTPKIWHLIASDLRLLASFDTLRAAVATLRAQFHPEPSWFAGDGQRLGEIFFRRPWEEFVVEGPRAYFDKINRLEVGFQTEGLAPSRNPPKVTPAPLADPEQSSLAYIRRIVEFCRTQNIDLSIFITPAHAHQLEIAAATGAWPAIENAKRALVDLLATDARRHAGRPPIPLFDFARYSSVTTEPLPPLASRQEMRYYWDSSHFKASVGDWVLDRVLDYPAQSHGAPPDFGVQLGVDSIEDTLAQQRVAQAAYRRQAAAELAPLRELVHARLAPEALPPSLVSATAPVR